MKVSRSKAIALLEALGFKASKALNSKRIAGKLNKLPEVVEENQEIEDEKLADLLAEVLKTVEEGDEIEVIPDEETSDATDSEDEGESEEDEEEKPKKPKKPEKPKSDKRPVRDSKGRPYFAGQVLRDFGYEFITDKMVVEVDERLGRPNPTESEAWLKLSTHVVRGYLSKG